MRRAAASLSPGALAGSGLRASVTGGFAGSGFATSGLGLAAAASGSGFLDGATTGGGASRSSSSFASRGGNSSTLLRSTFGTGNHGMIKLKRRQTSSTRLSRRARQDDTNFKPSGLPYSPPRTRASVRLLNSISSSVLVSFSVFVATES